jgi:large subunit ribosomal protein L20
MSRVKKWQSAHKRKKHVLKHAKGYRWGRKSKYRLAKDALRHAWEYAYRDRRVRKRDKRALWQTQINAACRAQGLTYSRFINLVGKNKIALDRKILSALAQDHPDIFKKIVEKTKESAK